MIDTCQTETNVRPPGNRLFSEREYPKQEMTREVIAACYSVHSTLGFGFKESAYRRALVVELDYRGFVVRQEVPYRLEYRGVDIGCYRADLIVENQVVVEVKTGLFLDPASVPQTLNYLKASNLSVGLVCYFGPKLDVKRVVCSANSRGTSNAEDAEHAEDAEKDSDDTDMKHPEQER